MGGWVELAKMRDAVYFYKPEQIKKDGDVIKVWIKNVPANESTRLAVIERNTAIYKKTKFDFSDYSYALVLWNIDCAEQKIRIISLANYSRTGKVIAARDLEGRAWNNIVPDSLGEHFATVLCR